jgi:hypothetical protein
MGNPVYFVVDYDNEASGPFTAEGANLTWDAAASSGFIITVIDRGTTGKLYCALLTGTIPDDNDQMTQGSTTADAVEDAALIAYPAYARQDLEVAGNGNITWDSGAPALGTTHSFKFDGQTTNCIVGDILEFSGGQKAELIEIESDVGASGEYNVRFITPLDTLGLPDDNATFTNGGSGDGVVDGQVHTRAYSPLDLHRMLADLNDDEDIYDDDDLSRVDPTPSDRSTDEIISLLGTVNIDATVIKHMYGGSISQDSGKQLISGLDVQVTSPESDTQPVIIQNDAIVTDYWKNAYMPDSIKGQVRIMLKTRHDGVDIDGRRVKGKLLEFNNIYFTGGTTLGTASTALALFSSTDGNNQTAAATVAGAPYNTIVLTEGFQLINHNNGNGNQPFGLKIDFGSASSLQCYERTKYIQRRGTAETIFGRDATYFDGINLNFPYDNLTGAFSEDEKVCWGTVITWTGQSTNFTVGEVVEFDTAGTPTWGRLLYQNDAGATGTGVFDFGGNALPGTSKTMTGLDSGGDGTTSTVGTNTASGTGTLIADDTTDDDLYISRLTGVLPVDNSEIYGMTSDADCLVDGTPQTRTINNQFVGVYTGTNYQTNFGISIDPSDAIVGDKYPDLDGGEQEPPNNQDGEVTGLKEYDTVTCYPWDGSSYDVNNDPEPDYDEMALATALVAATSTQVDVGAGNIPDNTPQIGNLRVERDSDGNMDLIPYDSHDGSRYFEIVGTAPSNAAISNDVMRAPIDKEMSADGTASFTAVKGAGSTQFVITVRNGYTALRNGPIKVAKSTATFGASGFSVPASRISDA